MKRQPNRLPADAKHGFGGGAIDRSKPLTFRLNHRPIEAFAGDTVLSALLAAGIDTAGTYHGEPIAIDERFAPPVALQDNPAVTMPMDRAPVIAGLKLVTVGPRQSRFALGRFAPRLASLLTRGGRTTAHSLDDPRALEGTWIHDEPVETMQADLVVIGGGIAGMSAALAGANIGGRIILVERRPELGGDGRFFGTEGDERPPEDVIASQIERIRNLPSINVFTSSEAFSLAGNRLRIHQVRVRDGELTTRVIRLVSPRIVLATGSAERLPTFPGNRSPGIVGAAAAYHSAERYGIWQGKRTILSTSHNYAYRLALLAQDAGIAVQRVADSRASPQSRFVDFCKASAITLASGLGLRAVEPSPSARNTVNVSFSVAIDGGTGETEPMSTDLLVAAGNWQPRLALWLMGGGGAQHQASTRTLVGRGTLDGIQLAGSAAGYRGSGACVASGAAAVAMLYRKEAPPVDDPEIDAIYETPPAIAPIAAYRPGRGVTFLDGGTSFTERPPQFKKDATVLTPAQVGSLSIGDVVAAVEIGSIPPAEAGTIAQERCLGGADLSDTGWRPVAPSVPPSDEPPAYLNGRFGTKPQSVVVTPNDGRRFEPGCMVFPNTDTSDPLAAVGVVTGPVPDGTTGARALVSRAVVASGISLFVRDTSGAIAVKVAGEKLKPAVKPAEA